jgi:phage terminase large subunit-like protein
MYAGYMDLDEGIMFTEKMLKGLVKQVFKKEKFTIRGHEVDFGGKWEKIDYISTVKKMTGIDLMKATEEEMKSKFGDIMVPVIQGKKTLSGPMKSLGAELESNSIVYNNNPILKWCLSNVAIEMDKNLNIQPCKTNNQRRRIDGFAGLLNAWVVYETFQEDYLNII